MRKIVLIITFLFAAVIAITVFYFSRIKLPGQNTADVISEIPTDAALVFEFKNEPEFYDLFSGSGLLASFIGQNKASAFKIVYQNLLQKGFFADNFNHQSFFISMHPAVETQQIELLLTTNAPADQNLGVELNAFMAKTTGSLNNESIGLKKIFILTFPGLKEALYISSNHGIVAASFSKAMLIDFLDDRKTTKTNDFTQLSDQQNKNSTADLYVNYQQFPALLKQLFRTQANDFFSFLNDFPANAALSLNYKSDALLFNGYTETDTSSISYLHIFLNQKPVENQLKSIFPASTALAVNFAFNEPAVFWKSLKNWQLKTNNLPQQQSLFNQIKRETGVAIAPVFYKQLGQEFAIVTTASQEKLAIIKVKNGSDLDPYLRNVSIDPNTPGTALKYPNLFFYLLGKPFSHFKQPYFKVIDNYLILANTQSALDNYLQNYHQQHFLENEKAYFNFDQLQASQSNISFFIQFANANALLGKALNGDFAKVFKSKNSFWKNNYAASLQFTSADNHFYTNFYLQEKIKNSIADSILTDSIP